MKCVKTLGPLKAPVASQVNLLVNFVRHCGGRKLYASKDYARPRLESDVLDGFRVNSGTSNKTNEHNNKRNLCKRDAPEIEKPHQQTDKCDYCEDKKKSTTETFGQYAIFSVVVSSLIVLPSISTAK